MKIGVQTNAWSDDIHYQAIGRMVAEIAECGYDGLEIGAHRVNLDQPAHFRKLVEAHNLKIAGIHTGGAIYDGQAMESVLAGLPRVAAFAAAAGSTNLMFSGRAKEGGKTAEDFKIEAGLLNRAGEIAHQHGLTLCFHNHYWEIEQDCRELDAICSLTDPALVSLCLDIGWVHRAGGSPVKVMQAYASRIAVIHLKDQVDNQHWTEVGSGVVDFPPIIKAAVEHPEWWLTVERDQPMPDAKASSLLSRIFLKTLGL